MPLLACFDGFPIVAENVEQQIHRFFESVGLVDCLRREEYQIGCANFYVKLLGMTGQDFVT